MFLLKVEIIFIVFQILLIFQFFLIVTRRVFILIQMQNDIEQIFNSAKLDISMLFVAFSLKMTTTKTTLLV